MQATRWLPDRLAKVLPYLLRHPDLFLLPVAMLRLWRWDGSAGSSCRFPLGSHPLRLGFRVFKKVRSSGSSTRSRSLHHSSPEASIPRTDPSTSSMHAHRLSSYCAVPHTKAFPSADLSIRQDALAQCFMHSGSNNAGALHCRRCILNCCCRRIARKIIFSPACWIVFALLENAAVKTTTTQHSESAATKPRRIMALQAVSSK